MSTQGVVVSSDLSQLRAVNREPLASEIARQLISYLFESGNDIKPGDRLPSERRLAEVFGVGRSAVREALKSLSLLGLVEIRQGAGTYLKSPDSELLPRVIEWGLLLGQRTATDLVEARRHLEQVVAGLAAKRRSEEDLDQLQEFLSGMEEAGRDLEAFVDADAKFHLTLARASRNVILADILASIQPLLRVWIARVIHAGGPEQREDTCSQHRRVLKAVEKGDPEAAVAAMAAHMNAAAAKLEDTIHQDVDHSSRPG